MPPSSSPAKNGQLAEHPTRAPQQEAASPIAKNRTSAPHAPSPRVRPLATEPPNQTSAQSAHAPSADEPQTTRRRDHPSEIAQNAERPETHQTDLPSHPEETGATIARPALHVLRTNAPHHAKKQARAGTVLALCRPSAQGGHPPHRTVENLTATDLGELQNALRKPQPRRNRPQPQRKRAGTRGTDPPVCRRSNSIPTRPRHPARQDAPSSQHPAWGCCIGFYLQRNQHVRSNNRQCAHHESAPNHLVGVSNPR